jgi:hypothetical protein
MYGKGLFAMLSFLVLVASAVIYSPLYSAFHVDEKFLEKHHLSGRVDMHELNEGLASINPPPAAQ